MSNTANNILPTSVPKLDVSGANWAIFALCFQTVIQGKGLWRHFDGSSPCLVLSSPVQPSPAAVSAIAATTTSAVPAPTTPAPISTQEAIDTWQRNESIAHSLLAQRLPDSTFIVASSHPSVKLMWDAITKDYTYKSVFSQAHLRREFTSARCPEKGDIQAFLNDLRMKKAELSAVGVNISDDDYRNSIIQSLPHWLATFASNQLTAARLAGHDIEPELLITFICDEWDRTRLSGRNSL